MKATKSLAAEAAPHKPEEPRGGSNALRRRPVVGEIARSWRDLTRGGARTLVACSGGADSTALLLALAAVTSDLVVGHVVHDLRPVEESHADRDAVEATAGRLGLPFAQASVRVRHLRENAEAAARRARYAALTELATTHRCSCVATAHHADDQLESVLMALLRGAGPAGLRGVAAKRRLEGGVTLIRPMLNITRDQARSLCRAAEVAWSEDLTNLDSRRLRAALRQGPLAELTRLAPHGALRASRTASLLRQSAALVGQRACEVFGGAESWPRARLREELPVVLGEGLRRAAARLLQRRRMDRLTGAVIDPAIRAIRDRSTEPRRFDWPRGLTLVVTTRDVRLESASVK